MPATLFIVYANGSIRSIGHNTQSEILSELLDEQDPRFPRENIIKMEFMQAGKPLSMREMQSYEIRESGKISRFIHRILHCLGYRHR